MRTLYLLRHAKSSHKDPNLTDFDRPLNKRGRGDAPRIASELAFRGEVPQLIISSPARRAWRTAKAVAAVMELDRDQLIKRDRLYHFGSPDPLLRVIRKAPADVSRLMLVGHNPAFTDLANLLAGTDIDNVPTCGVVAIDLPSDSWRKLKQGELRFTLWPREL